jgi:outer membrane receptor protein involved in Fe transport
MLSRRLILWFLILGASSATPARGQSSTATLTGTVADNHAAALPGTDITALNVETGQRRTVRSADDGTFTIPLLPPGRYAVTATRQGFSPTEIRDIVLNVNDQRTLQIQLQVGQLEETVVVRAEAGQVDTQTGTLKEVVGQERIVGLPLNGRNALQLQRLVPGAGGVVAPGQGQNESLSINGSRPNANNYTLDGGDNHDPFFNTPSVFPNPDALQEFTIQTSAYSAVYGRNAGAVINAITRSGTNTFRGSMFEFLRHEKLNSRSLFATENPPFRRDQFGGSVGGPIRRDRTFFFTAYQGWRENSAPGVITAIVPTAAQRAGDLSSFTTAILDPVTRAPFPGNVIPGTRLNQPVQRFLAAFVPLPNGPGGLLATASGQAFDQDQVVAKIDHQWSAANRLTSRLLYNMDRRREATGDIPGFFADTDYTNWNVALSDTHIFSPRLLNVARFTYNRVDREQLSVVPGNQSYLDFGLQITRPFTNDVPAGIHTQVDGFFNAFSRFPLNQFRRFYQFGNELTTLFGNHQLRVGAEVSRSILDRAEFFRGDPFMRFRNNFTGNALADLLLGRPSTFEQQSKTESNIRTTEVGVYVQDDWKVSKRVSLNLGLRWDPYFPLEDTQNRFGQFIPGVQSAIFPTAPAGAVFPGDPGVSRATIDRRLADFAPRVGFAHDVFGNQRTSVRGGYGVFRSQIRQQANNGINLAQPFAVRLTITNPPLGLDNPYSTSGNPFPFSAPSGAAAQTYAFTRPVTLSHFRPDFRNALVQQWNVNLQQDLSSGYVVTVAYVGNRGDHLFQSYQSNPARPGTGSVDSRRLFAPAFGPITTLASVGESTYHALQLSLNKRLTRGFTLLASYSRSRFVDTASGDGDGGSNPFDLSSDKGTSDLDIPHMFVASFVYDLPKLEAASAALRHILGSWHTTGIVLLRSGSPFSVASGRDNSQSGVNLDRADVVGDPHLPGNRSRDDIMARYFNTAAFAQNAAGTFGTSPRNFLRGPGYTNVDFGLFKDFPGLRGSHKIQFRTEVFNLFNRQNLGNPDANLSSPNFGRITNTVGDPRVIQLALKYVF